MKFGLFLKATLENISNICPNNEEFRWYMKIKCGSCNEVASDFVYFNTEDRIDLKGGRGTANFVFKCKFCRSVSSIELIKSTIRPYTIEKSENFELIAEFDCRGIEPIEFDPRICWTATSTKSSTKFPDVNLSERDWVEYDESGNCNVGIYDVESKFMSMKGI